jgi:hypothetical protein
MKQGTRVPMQSNMSIDQLTDIELEETLHLLQMEMRWKRNHAYALPDFQSTQIMIAVKEGEEFVKKLRAEREHRIIRGNYHPFT